MLWDDRLHGSGAELKPPACKLFAAVAAIPLHTFVIDKTPRPTETVGAVEAFQLKRKWFGAVSLAGRAGPNGIAVGLNRLIALFAKLNIDFVGGK